MKAKDWPRALLTAFIMALFGYVVANHYSEAIEQTVLAIVMLAVGFWLGSSKGSSDKTELLGADGQEPELIGGGGPPWEMPR